MKRSFLLGIVALMCLVTGVAVANPQLSDYTVASGPSDQELRAQAQRAEQIQSLSLVSENEAAHHEFIRAVEYVQAVEDAKLIAYAAAVEQAEAARRAAEARRQAAAEEARRKATTSTRAASTASGEPSSKRSSGGSCGGWEGLIASYFPNEVGTACRVMMCESNGNPRAVNSSSGASGLFQVMPSWSSRYQQVTGVPYYDGRFDPNANTKFAAYLVREAGWASQFACY